MMNGGYEVVDAGHHGGGREVIKTEWKTIRTTFHSFVSLPAQCGEKVSSPTLECHGLKWKLEVYPGGYSSLPNVAFFIRCLSSVENGQDIKASYVIRIPTIGYGGGTRMVSSDGTLTFGTSTSSSSWGGDGVHRAFLLNTFNNYLIGGNLTIEADIQVVFDSFPWAAPTVSTSNVRPVCSSACSAIRKEEADERARLKEKYGALQETHAVAKAKFAVFKEAHKKMSRQLKPLSLDMRELLKSGDHSDVTFEIGRNGEGKKKKTFRVHSLILFARCPVLASLIEDCEDDNPIPIEDVEPALFYWLLCFVYGGQVPDEVTLKKDAQAIIRTSDRFGCTGLKLFAEAELASNFHALRQNKMCR